MLRKELYTNLENFYEEIHKAKKNLEDKIQERADWCRKNSKQIKPFIPVKGNIYLLTKEYEYVVPRRLSDKDRKGMSYKLYFKMKDFTFYPERVFGSNGLEKYPIVRGDLYCDELNIVNKDYPCSINDLMEDDFCMPYNIRVQELSESFIYVMIDKNTGYYKIGKSINPNYREKTLQSEKPTVELLYKSKTGSKTEKELHRIYASKRIRGEWFDLTGSDLIAIKGYLNIDN